MEEKTITVTQLSNYIKQIFDAEELLFHIKVIGEVSGLSVVRGVAYFILKDENATLSCVCFNAENFDFKNGDNVVVTGSPKYYVKGGKLNFNVSKIIKSGVGELYQKFLELKEELDKKGYFDLARKKLLPDNIKRVGVVTSKEGAVIQDIINVRTRRNPYIDIVLFPVKVQGVNAEYEISKGIKFLEQYDVDLIIVARGGGSLEDLQPFNTKVVADAVYECKKFVLSAVGHETDFTICDFCSDLRAPTPSVAAELVCENMEDKIERFHDLSNKLKDSIKNIYVSKQTEFVDLLKELKNEYQRKNESMYNKLKTLSVKMSNSVKSCVNLKEYGFNLIKSKLIKLNPSEILKLGYASIKCKNNHIKSASQISTGDCLELLLKDGVVSAIVNDVKENN